MEYTSPTQTILIVYDNFVDKSGFGDASIETESSNNITVFNNTVTNSLWEGIDLTSCSNCKIYRNNMINNPVSSFSIDDSNNNLIYENSITGNNFNSTGWVSETIFVLDSWNNTFFHNNVVFKPSQFYDNSANIWDNGYPSGGNYWGDYAGVDANNDGIGDTPYVFNANNVDRFPLMNPWMPVIALTGFSVSKGGSGYTTPVVLLVGGGGTGATAIARVSNGVIYGITLTNIGSGYTSPPSIVIRDPSPRAKGAVATIIYVTL